MHLSRRKQLLIGLGGIIIVLVGYILASVLYWQQYQRDIQSYSRAKTSLETALNLPSKTSEERKAKMTGLQDASKSLFAADMSCKPAWWLGWQQALPSVSSQVSDCQGMKSKHMAVRSALEVISSYIADETNLVSAFTPLDELKGTITDKTWDDAEAKWKTVLESIKSQKVSKDFASVKSKTESQVAKVVSAWGKLKAADKTKSSSDFTAAYNALDRSITDLASVADVDEAKLDSLAKKLETAVDKL